MPATPAATAFCTISNDTRPLTTSSRSVAGSCRRAARGRRPCRRRCAARRPHARPQPPSAPASAAACTAPVLSKPAGARAWRRAAPPAPSARPSSPASAVRCAQRGRSSTSALHTPQAAEVTKARGRGGAHAGAQRDVHAVGVVLAAGAQRDDVAGAGRRTRRPASRRRVRDRGPGCASASRSPRRPGRARAAPRRPGRPAYGPARRRPARGRSRAACWSPPCDRG